MEEAKQEKTFGANGEDEATSSLTQIGIALSVEKNIDRLLEMIVFEARRLSKADAGSLYIINHEKRTLDFKVFQNDTMENGAPNSLNIEVPKIKRYIPKIPLIQNNTQNYDHVSAYVALTGKTVNIPDVYHTASFDFTGPKHYDAQTGYQTKSMLVIPMKNHENKTIGVLQLINAMDYKTNEIISFSSKIEKPIISLASQAAVALTNFQLIKDLNNLFYDFIKSIAMAIDEKSAYTGQHIRRVVDLTMTIAQKMNEADKGAFTQVHFTEDEMEELRLAAWMHDLGKVTTPEYIIDKSTKLETIFDRITLIETRFQLIAKTMENNYLIAKIDLLENGLKDSPEYETLNRRFQQKLVRLRDDFKIIQACNKNDGGRMTDDHVQRIQAIACKHIVIDGKQTPFLTLDETRNLCIRQGTLLEEERKIIENHVTMTMKITEQLPFPQKFKNVSQYASEHHEKLDGSGYHQGLSNGEIAIQSRIIAIADIFEALTAKDRPYRKPLKLSQAIEIMTQMKNDGHIDPHIFELFIEKGLYQEYARKELTQEQIDNTEKCVM